MDKFFRNMPPALEQYNPEDTFDKFRKSYETFDENGLLHSFNDEPSKVIIHDTKQKDIMWHSHGELYRDDDRPARINLSRNSFMTLDENRKPHSYGNMPSKIDSTGAKIWLAWHNNGVPHRSGDLPAEVTSTQKEIVEYAYYEQGQLHRGNNQLSLLTDHSKAWLVKGIRHNSVNYSALELEKGLDSSSLSARKAWHLYGTRVKEETFSAIKSFEAEKNVPLWVAFLYKLDVIGDSEINVFLNESGSWDNSFPISWVLKAWHITDEAYSDKVRELHLREKRFVSKRNFFPLTPILEIVNFEEGTNNE